jgi:RNA polymerase sigma-70 factor (ECF subfamily)
MKKSTVHTIFDELLIGQAQLGDEKAFRLIFKRWNEPLYRYACRVTKEKNQAKDALQNAWISISKNLQKLQNPGHFGPWARKIVYFKCIDLLREISKRRTLHAPKPTENHENPKITNLLKALKSLPENHRLILTMHYLEEMPIAEIAYVLDLNPGTVKSRLFHARNKLKETLKK